jgi:hypothetical protein
MEKRMGRARIGFHVLANEEEEEAHKRRIRIMIKDK